MHDSVRARRPAEAKPGIPGGSDHFRRQQCVQLFTQSEQACPVASIPGALRLVVIIPDEARRHRGLIGPLGSRAERQL